LTEAVGNKLYEWFRAGKKIDGKSTPYMSLALEFATLTTTAMALMVHCGSPSC
jgi:L-2,4-diaminobutyrate decarboxylase